MTKQQIDEILQGASINGLTAEQIKELKERSKEHDKNGKVSR